MGQNDRNAKKTAETVLGVTFEKRKGDKETWWWNEEVQKSIKEKKEAKKAWDKTRNKNTKKIYKEKKSKAKKAVAMAKGRVYDDLYARLEKKRVVQIGCTVGLHQGSALSSFLFAVIMDRLTNEVRREPP